jgi:hypothetical protein
MANGITKDTFKTMSVDAKLNVLFDYAHESRNDVSALKKRTLVDKGIAFAGGIIGGIVAITGNWFFFRGQS